MRDARFGWLRKHMKPTNAKAQSQSNQRKIWGNNAKKDQNGASKANYCTVGSLSRKGPFRTVLFIDWIRLGLLIVSRLD